MEFWVRLRHPLTEQFYSERVWLGLQLYELPLLLKGEAVNMGQDSPRKPVEIFQFIKAADIQAPHSLLAKNVPRSERTQGRGLGEQSHVKADRGRRASKTLKLMTRRQEESRESKPWRVREMRPPKRRGGQSAS